MCPEVVGRGDPARRSSRERALLGRHRLRPPREGRGAPLPRTWATRAGSSADVAARCARRAGARKAFPAQPSTGFFDLGRRARLVRSSRIRNALPAGLEATTPALDPLLDAGACLLLDVCALVGNTVASATKSRREAARRGGLRGRAAPTRIAPRTPTRWSRPSQNWRNARETSTRQSVFFRRTARDLGRSRRPPAPGAQPLAASGASP